MRALHPLVLTFPAVIALGCNEPPTAPTVSLTPEAPITTDNLVVEYGGSTDPNANDEVVYRVVWFKNGDSQSDLADQPTVNFGKTEKGDVWRVTVSASDGDVVGQGTEAEVVILNAPPTATVEVNLEAPFTDDTVRTTVAKQDADRDPVTVTYEWTVNGSVHSNSRQDLPATETVKGQVWEVSVTPNDGEVDGEPATASFTVANTPPEVTSARISPLYPTRYDTIICEGVGWFDLDEDDPAYDVQWVVNGDNYSTTAELSATDLVRGDSVRCLLTPNDGDDAGDTVQSSEVEVQNTPPTVTDVEISPDDPTKDDVVTAVISGAEDLDGDTVTYRYEWKVNGVVAGDTPTLPSSRFAKGDLIRLEIYPFDGIDEGSPVTSNTVIGGNNLPEITGVTLSPTELYTNDVLSAEVFTTDPDGDRVDLDVEWYVDGTKVAETSTDLDGTADFDKGQTVYLTVTPDDGDGEGAPVTTDTITVLNSVPTAPVLIFSPAEPTDGEEIVCVIDEDSVDADGDSLTYTFRWQVNGAGTTDVTTTDETDDTLNAGAWTEGDDVVCTVTSFDGTATSPEGSYGLAYGSKNNPGASCKDILTERPDYETGTYWIDPDEDGDTSDAIEVYCDMDTASGGWTYMYYVDAEYFDAFYANSTSLNTTAPTAINKQKDIWEAPTDLTYTETLVGCTTQNDAATHYWRYASKRPFSDYTGSSATNAYHTFSSTASSTTAASCHADYPGKSSDIYGFAVVESSSCGSCRNILWGMYHYKSGRSGCNSTSTSYGSHTSKWRSMTIDYPVCARSQTSNGKFFIGVR